MECEGIVAEEEECTCPRESNFLRIKDEVVRVVARREYVSLKFFSCGNFFLPHCVAACVVVVVVLVAVAMEEESP